MSKKRVVISECSACEDTCSNKTTLLESDDNPLAPHLCPRDEDRFPEWHVVRVVEQDITQLKILRSQKQAKDEGF